MRILISAGEASGDYYASGVATALARHYPGAELAGCAGPRLQALGVKPVVDAAQLGVVGLAEVVVHLPRIYGEYRKLVRWAKQWRPDFAILSDNPDFNLRVAREMQRIGVPVYYVVAPQVWAWRQGRVRNIRRVVNRLFCLFPFEEPWFQKHQVPATYIGHPMAATVRAQSSREEFAQKHGLDESRDWIALLPGSRTGEAMRHLPYLLETVELLKAGGERDFVLAMPTGFRNTEAYRRFREPIQRQSIKVIEGASTDAIAHACVALAASGTVTIEAAILGTPTVTFYRVNPLTWWVGRRLVKVPYFSMVNLVAGRQVIPEYIQEDMTAERLALAAERLLGDPAEAARMREGLAAVKAALSSEGDPFARAAQAIADDWAARSQGERPVASLRGELGNAS